MPIGTPLVAFVLGTALGPTPTDAPALLLSPEPTLTQAARRAPPEAIEGSSPRLGRDAALWRLALACVQGGGEADNDHAWAAREAAEPMLLGELAQLRGSALWQRGHFLAAANAWQRAVLWARNEPERRLWQAWQTAARRWAGVAEPFVAPLLHYGGADPDDWQPPTLAFALAPAPTTPGHQPAFWQHSAAALRFVCMLADPPYAEAACHRLHQAPMAVQLPSDDERLAWGLDVLRRRGPAQAAPWLQPGPLHGAPMPRSVGWPMAALLAQVAERKRDGAQALQWWRRAAQLAPAADKADAHRRLAEALFAQEQFEPARQAFLTARHFAADAQQRHELHFLAARCAVFAGEYATALDELLAYVNVSTPRPHVDSARWFGALCAYLLFDWAQAETQLLALVHGPPSSLLPQAEYWLGRLAAARGTTEEAHAHWRRAARHGPSYYGALARARLTPSSWRAAPAPPAPPGRVLMQAVMATQRHSPHLGASALAWTHARGQRAARLMRAGLQPQAAEALAQVPPAPGATPAEAALARAELAAWLAEPALAARFADEVLAQALRYPLPMPAQQRALRLSLAEPWANDVVAAAQAGVPPSWLWAIMRQESGFEPTARSRSNARGLMQLLPATAARIAERLGEPGPNAKAIAEPARNIRYGGWYVAQLAAHYQGHVALGVAAYNAGPVAVDRWLHRFVGQDAELFVELVPRAETRRYIKAVLGAIEQYQALAGEPQRLALAPLPVALTPTVSF